MTNRENYFSIIKRTGFEYIPHSFNLCPHLKENYEQRLEDFRIKNNIEPNPVVNSRPVKMIEPRPDDVMKYYITVKEGTKIDAWGVAHEPGSEAAMHMTYMRCPLREADTIEELREYPYPRPVNDEEYLMQVKAENAEHIKNDKIVCGQMQCTVWEHAWYMRGMERLMMDMVCDEELAEFVLDTVTEIAIKQAQFFANAGCDVVFFGDDIGMQKTIMMSEELYTTWLKPRMKRVIDAARAVKPDIIVFYHSCGFVQPFIPHLAEIGVDVLNPVQPECMNFAEIHAKYKDIISFNGTIGTQTTMPFGTPEEVTAEVMKNLKAAGKNGGLLVCPTHMLEPEVPPENIEAYMLACHNFKA